VRRPLIALTQGDPAGIGPEIVLAVLADLATGTAGRSDGWADIAPGPPPSGIGQAWTPLLIAERAALEPLRTVLPGFPWDRLAWLDAPPARARIDELAAAGAVPALDPVDERRTVRPGEPGPADAAGALAALDAGAALARSGVADALVTAPLGKAAIARWADPGFRGHTDHLARAAGLERYGRDYLMAFLAPDLQVALLTTHLPLAEALAAVRRERIEEALDCLHRHAAGRTAVAGLNPHAGESGLLGPEDEREIAPAVAAASARGLDAHGPESADSLFARARRGEFDWVLALYHDQGLIAVKTASPGHSTNWTLGLPYVRTSPNHGTAYAIAGRGKADAGPLRHAVETALGLLAGRLPRRRPPAP
jgi:4-hydroxythreonine-4-phosphate dehydrogenase